MLHSVLHGIYLSRRVTDLPLISLRLFAQVTYDPSLVSYEELLGAFWKQIDPTQVNGQGGDQGTQYRTGVYTHTEEQLQIAEASKSDMAKQLQVLSAFNLSPHYCVCSFPLSIANLRVLYSIRIRVEGHKVTAESKFSF